MSNLQFPDENRSPNFVCCGPRAAAERSAGRLALVIGPAYGLFALAMLLSWDLASAPSIVPAALMALVLAAVMCTDFRTILAAGAGLRFEARSGRRKSK